MKTKFSSDRSIFIHTDILEKLWQKIRDFAVEKDYRHSQVRECNYTFHLYCLVQLDSSISKFSPKIDQNEETYLLYHGCITKVVK